MISMSTKARLYFWALWCFGAISIAALPVDPTNISFESPRQTALISSSACTVSVRANPNVESVHLNVRYGLSNGKTDTLLDLGTITQPPFKLLWNITDVPNQLFKGMVFSAEGVLRNGTHQQAKVEGVFLYNKSTTAPIRFQNVSNVKKTLLYSDTIGEASDSLYVRAFGKFASEGLHFTIMVVNPFFSSSLPIDKLANMGVEILLDPLLAKTAFPTDKNIFIVIPLSNKPYRLQYNVDKGPDGNTFDFSMTTADYPYQVSIKKAFGKGYKIDVVVPQEILGGIVPDSLGCNILIKNCDKTGRLLTASLCGVTGNSAYCPVLWTTLKRENQVFFGNIFFVAGIGFLCGLLLVLLAKAAQRLMVKRAKNFNQFELPEADKKKLEAIYDCIEQNVTKKDFLLHEVSVEIGIPGSKIESLLKKYNGNSFKIFVMKSRIEIAKERLRSSHASLGAIAESCGFKNIGEMMNFFQKLCRTTPTLYRRENLVA